MYIPRSCCRIHFFSLFVFLCPVHRDEENVGEACAIKSIFYESKEHPFSSLFSPSLPPTFLHFVYTRYRHAAELFFAPVLSTEFCSVWTTSDRILMTFHISNRPSRVQRSRDDRETFPFNSSVVGLTRAVAPGDKTFRLIYCRFGN